MKECSKCHAIKAYSEFHKLTKSPDGYKNQCKACVSAYVANRAKHYTVKYRYGITKEQFDSMLAEQDGACAACRRVFDDKVKPEVDHDHTCCPTVKTCGKCVRGLLCHKCNTMAGGIEYNLPYLDAVLNYLTYHLNRKNGFTSEDISYLENSNISEVNT